MGLDMFIWVLLHGAKCSFSQWCNSSGEENITSRGEQKAASSFGGKCAIARNLKAIALFDQFSLFFSHLRNISQTTFSERCSTMAETMNETEMSETQWIVLKKIEHGYPGILYHFASFGTFHSLNLRWKEQTQQLISCVFYHLSLIPNDTSLNEIPPLIFGKNRAVFWVRNLKTSRFRLCRASSFLCEDKFQG